MAFSDLAGQWGRTLTHRRTIPLGTVVLVNKDSEADIAYVAQPGGGWATYRRHDIVAATPEEVASLRLSRAGGL
jgi:hypothetical protein